MNFFVSYKSYVPFSRYSSFYIFNHDLPNLCRHDEYYYMGQGAFSNISFEPQLINPPNLLN